MSAETTGSQTSPGFVNGIATSSAPGQNLGTPPQSFLLATLYAQALPSALNQPLPFPLLLLPPYANHSLPRHRPSLLSGPSDHPRESPPRPTHWDADTAQSKCWSRQLQRSLFCQGEHGTNASLGGSPGTVTGGNYSTGAAGGCEIFSVLITAWKAESF